MTSEYRSFHPAYSHSLVNSLRSYIKSKLDHEGKTLEFIKKIQQKLQYIHEYNCQVAKHKQKYPRSKKLDSLLVKYVELEFEVLYQHNANPPKNREFAAQVRILRLFKGMLQQSVQYNETTSNKSRDVLVKKEILKLLGEVKSPCLVQNKLVYNIAQELIKSIKDSSEEFSYLRHPLAQETQRNLATSDYGTDDSDSDLENDGFWQNAQNPTTSRAADCVEVLVTQGGIAPIPTIEFTDDDGDSFMIYLQKEVGSTKKKRSLLKPINKNEKHRPGHREQNSIKQETNESSVQKVDRSNSIIKESQRDEVIVCLDSEDDTEDSGTTKNHSCVQTKNVKEKQGVVTFEIIDDDESDLNYMVYLQEEVNSNQKSKTGRVAEEIVICSDSEDEADESDKNANANSPIERDIEKEMSQDDNDRSQEQENVERRQIYSEPPNIGEEVTTNAATVAPQENMSLFLLESDIGMSMFDTAKANFLVDPSVIFEVTHKQTEENRTSDSEGSDLLGGPVLSEKMQNFDDLSSFQECRINESLLEEILLDDSYLLEGRKEFEELEYFLFNDSKEKQSFFTSNFSVEEDETVLQSDIFNKDIASIEALLDDTQFFNEMISEKKGFDSDELIRNNKRKSVNGQSNNEKKIRSGCGSQSEGFNLETRTNINTHSSNKLKKDAVHRRGKNFKAIIKQSEKGNDR